VKHEKSPIYFQELFRTYKQSSRTFQDSKKNLGLFLDEAILYKTAGGATRPFLRKRGGTPHRLNSWVRSKMEWRKSGKVQIRGSEPDLKFLQGMVADAARNYNFPSVLSCIGIRQDVKGPGCDRDSSQRIRQGRTSSSIETRESGKLKICKKRFRTRRNHEWVSASSKLSRNDWSQVKAIQRRVALL